MRWPGRTTKPVQNGHARGGVDREGNKIKKNCGLLLSKEQSLEINHSEYVRKMMELNKLNYPYIIYIYNNY
mgnify:CR=1 FL=1